MQQFESLVQRRLTHVYHGTVRSSETFLEVTVHGLGINLMHGSELSSWIEGPDTASGVAL
jgi:hypothetical protein